MNLFSNIYRKTFQDQTNKKDNRSLHFLTNLTSLMMMILMFNALAVILMSPSIMRMILYASSLELPLFFPETKISGKREREQQLVKFQINQIALMLSFSILEEDNLTISESLLI